jgi:hypothetical protein
MRPMWRWALAGSLPVVVRWALGGSGLTLTAHEAGAVETGAFRRSNTSSEMTIGRSPNGRIAAMALPRAPSDANA